MSVENLKEYARRCATDPELRAKARDIGITDMDEHMRHAERLGLAWTMDDVAAFRKEVVDDEGDFADLTEDELERVAGGIVTTTAALAAAGAAVVVAGFAGTVAAGVGTATSSGEGGW